MIALALPDDGSFDPRRLLPLETFLRQQHAPSYLTLAGDPRRPADTRHAWHAVGHLGRFLKRQALIADLTTETLERLAVWLIGQGRKPSTVNRIAQELVRLAYLAAAEGLLEVAPAWCKLAADCDRRRALTVGQFERLIAIASLRKGEIAGIPAGDWWCAFLLTIANTGLSAATLLALPYDALTLRTAVGRGGRRRQLERASLRAEGLVFSLHLHTADALKRLLGPPRDRLFPWPGTAKNTMEMALWYFHRLCRRACIPVQKYGAFERVAKMVEERGVDALNRVDPDRIARERAAAAEEQAAADRRRREKVEDPSYRSNQADVPRFYRKPKKTRDVYFIANHGPRSLRTFLHETYAPLRLAARKGGARTLIQYESCLNVLAAYNAADVTLDQLDASFLEGFLGWAIRSGRSPATANRISRSISSLWRCAMRKRKLPWSAEPEFVEKIPMPKREVRTWTLAQFEQILMAAAEAPGDFRGVPTCQLLPALLITIYFTGLRLSALLQCRVADLDMETGWLSVDAAYQKHNSDQRFRLPEVALAAIRATNPADREMLFCGPAPGSSPTRLSSRGASLRKRLRRVLRGLGLDAGKRSMFHNVRRLSATQMVAAAGEAAAQKHLGHSDPSLLRFYVDRSQLQRPEAADVLPRLNWTPPAKP